MTILMLIIALATTLFLLAMFHNLRTLMRIQARPARNEEWAIRQRVAALARGNVLLQSGRYTTAEQLRARAARLNTYRFDD